MKLVHTCFLLFLGVGAASEALAGGNGGCLVAFEEGSSGGALPQGVRAVAPAGNEDPSRVRFSCNADRVSGLVIRLAPGQAAEARLVFVGSGEYAAGLDSGTGWPADWSRVDHRRLDSQTVIITLSVAAPDSAPAGRVFSDRLNLGSQRAGQAIPVTLEIIEGGPLFRDDFDDVDPVIGQFSMIHEVRQPSLRAVSGITAD